MPKTELESLVLSLMQQSPMNTGPSPPEDISPQSTLDKRPAAQGPSSSEQSPEYPKPSRSGTQRGVSPSPSDYGSLSIRQSGVTYVSSAHWVAILDSIAELKHNFAQEEEADEPPPDPVLQQQTTFPVPQLLYSNSLMTGSHLAPGIIHSQKFLREYEEFWKAPQDAPIIWVGLLLGIICVSTQFRNAFLISDYTPAAGGVPDQSLVASERQFKVETFRENIIQCLTLGKYIKGGPHVLETMIIYLLVELFFLKDVDTGIWVLSGNIVQIALHMGYHRDAKHFPNISPFAGEMRRRVWGMITQIDYTSSTQIGLPRLVKESQCDTEPPRNLFDTDFDESTTELPPSRPESETTPLLYVIAKLRLLPVGVKVADLATAPHPHSYAETIDLDKQIDAARNALPPNLKWTSLASSLHVQPQIIMERIYLEVCLQRLKIDLHRKFLEPSRVQKEYVYSRSTCLVAAMNILEFQHLVDEEIRVDGRLYQSRKRLSSAYIYDFLLATSILCFYLQTRTETMMQEQSSDGSEEAISVDKIKQLLRTSQVIWDRSSVTNKGARKAAAALRYILDLMPGDDFPSLRLETINETPAWQRFQLNFNSDLEQWPAIHNLDQLDPSL
ncbi:putative fungal specific transcription factor domain protein [Eutypa lata UCREL1]|uniref:Putative fungal specific transcription factor domain protein n=1 Tax=Eutypa lata (strain UCR-EL1) TaxID=1287681 RepID=M7SWN8_EUTLA|nr:putative fungal specific transcription factor domain protein [Eutypa lata UCREL1]